MTDAIVISARRWIGTPYCHQASARGSGCDCLGLLRGVWREVIGPEPVSVPSYTQDWKGPDDREPLWSICNRFFLPMSGSMDAGQIALFRMKTGGPAKHLGIITEGAEHPRFVHAYNRHGVIESALTLPWQRRIVGS